MTTEEIYCIPSFPSFIKVTVSLKGMKSPGGIKEEGIKRVQTLIKLKLDEIEQIPGWKLLPPAISNAIRHTIIRIAFGAYKIGLLLG